MTVRLWDVITGELRHTIKGLGSVPFGMSFSSDGRTLASGGGEGAIYLWNGTGGV